MAINGRRTVRHHGLQVLLAFQVPGEGYSDQVDYFSFRQEIVRQCSQHHAV
jgi:hypothetical protein